MAINVTKPSVNLREKLNELETNKGLKGNEILQAETAQEVRSLIGAGRKNLIINGDFRVSQRGDYTTATSAANGVYTLDRHQSLVDTVGVTFQDLGGELKYAATSSATGRFGFQQRIEEYTKLRGKQVTLSAKVTSNTSDVQLMIYDGSTFTSVNHSGNGSEEILTVTATLSSSASLARAYVFVSNNNLDVSVTTGDYFSVKELQLEEGSVATDFEHRSYGEELALCQRYYQTYGNGVNDGYMGASASGYATGSSQTRAARWTGLLPVSMRVAPTFVSTLFAGGNVTIGYQYTTPTSVTWYPQSSSAGSCYFAGDYTLDAEL